LSKGLVFQNNKKIPSFEGIFYNYQQDVPIWNNTGCSEIAVFFFACSIDFVLKRNIL